MKQHESREIEDKEEEFFSYRESGNIIEARKSLFLYNIHVFVDSNKFTHNLDGKAIFSDEDINTKCYWIHGKHYKKEQWELEVNRIKTLEEI